jgi:hypothetical protein
MERDSSNVALDTYLGSAPECQSNFPPPVVTEMVRNCVQPDDSSSSPDITRYRDPWKRCLTPGFKPEGSSSRSSYLQSFSPNSNFISVGNPVH